MTELAKQSVKELRRKAHDLNIKKWYGLKKEELIMALESFKIATPIVDVPPTDDIQEAQKEAIDNYIAMPHKKYNPKRTVSWIVLITLVITVPLFAWWVSQPSSSWYQPVLEFFKF